MLAYNIYVPIGNVRPIILWVCLCLIRLRPNEVLVADVSRLNRIRFFSLSHFRFVLGWVWPLSWGTLDFDKARRQLEQYYKRPLQKKKGWLIFSTNVRTACTWHFFCCYFSASCSSLIWWRMFFIHFYFFILLSFFCFVLLPFIIIFTYFAISHSYCVPVMKKIEN